MYAAHTVQQTLSAGGRPGWALPVVSAAVWRSIPRRAQPLVPAAAEYTPQTDKAEARGGVRSSPVVREEECCAGACAVEGRSEGIFEEVSGTGRGGEVECLCRGESVGGVEVDVVVVGESAGQQCGRRGADIWHVLGAEVSGKARRTMLRSWTEPPGDRDIRDIEDELCIGTALEGLHGSGTGRREGADKSGVEPGVPGLEDGTPHAGACLVEGVDGVWGGQRASSGREGPQQSRCSMAQSMARESSGGRIGGGRVQRAAPGLGLGWRGVSQGRARGCWAGMVWEWQCRGEAVLEGATGRAQGRTGAVLETSRGRRGQAGWGSLREEGRHVWSARRRQWPAAIEQRGRGHCTPGYRVASRGCCCRNCFYGDTGEEGGGRGLMRGWGSGVSDQLETVSTGTRSLTKRCIGWDVLWDRAGAGRGDVLDILSGGARGCGAPALFVFFLFPGDGLGQLRLVRDRVRCVSGRQGVDVLETDAVSVAHCICERSEHLVGRWVCGHIFLWVCGLGDRRVFVEWRGLVQLVDGRACEPERQDDVELGRNKRSSALQPPTIREATTA
ncbi:hypothetical protein PMAC_002616 [Pneumocystis sp. 'macacae']|nr:hypothetical protein PMAC_002616 [Pneumocystis sp. 'macacae']